MLAIGSCGRNADGRNSPALCERLRRTRWRQMPKRLRRASQLRKALLFSEFQKLRQFAAAVAVLAEEKRAT